MFLINTNQIKVIIQKLKTQNLQFALTSLHNLQKRQTNKGIVKFLEAATRGAL